MTYIAITYGTTKPNGDKALHGGKGAGLIDMARKGLPVPPALILTTAAWKCYRETGGLPEEVLEAIHMHLSAYPDHMQSVRSGAPVSMPGMMDTVLNVGVTAGLDATYPGAFRRFAIAWLDIVKGIGKPRIKELIGLVEGRAAGDPARFFNLLAAITEKVDLITIPQSRIEQVIACVCAVFDSWDTPRAKAYRAMHNIPEDMGTGCVIQCMVMGTAPGLSGSGVMFTRDPATGAPQMRGEIAFNAQGEEVVSGEVTPLPLEALRKTNAPKDHQKLYGKLESLCETLEHAFTDVQDIEFTVEGGNLYVLQTRTAKMSARARIETAVALSAGFLPKDRLSYLKARVSRGTVQQTMVPMLETDAPLAGKGLAASPGAISGKLVYATTPLAQVDKTCILVAEDTTPDDFPVMAKCGGILTKTGGFTCHSAVVARGIGVPAVVGCETLHFTPNGHASLGGVPLGPKMILSIDGATGHVHLGASEVKKAQPPRSIYAALHQIILEGGTKLPEGVYYYDCGLGQRVVLPLDPADTPRIARQLERRQTLLSKGKDVALGVEMQGLGEDMFDASPEALFAGLADQFGPLLKGAHILYGIPKSMAPMLAAKLGVTINTDAAVQYVDLLDLLG